VSRVYITSAKATVIDEDLPAVAYAAGVERFVAAVERSILVLGAGVRAMEWGMLFKERVVPAKERIVAPAERFVRSLEGIVPAKERTLRSGEGISPDTDCLTHLSLDTGRRYASQAAGREVGTGLARTQKWIACSPLVAFGRRFYGRKLLGL